MRKGKLHLSYLNKVKIYKEKEKRKNYNDFFKYNKMRSFEAKRRANVFNLYHTVDLP